MTRKQLVTRTEIARMAGQDKRHFLNRDAQHLCKPLGDIAGLTKLAFHLIEVPIGSVICAFHRHICEEECVYILEGTGTARIGARFCRSKLVILLPIRLGARRMTFAIRDHPF